MSSNLSSNYLNTQPLNSAHVGSFLLLMFLATFRLSSVVDVTLSLATVTVVVAAMLLMFKLYCTIGIVNYVRAYWQEISLFIVFIASCLMSTFVNLERFQSGELFKYAITPLAVYCAFFIIVSLFALPQNVKGLSLHKTKFGAVIPWVLFGFLALLSLWQFVDFESSKWLTQFFIAAEVWPSNNVNGFFRISTDLGAVLGAATLTCFGLSLIYRQHRLRHLWLGCGVLLLLAGVFSGARVFFLLIFVGVMVAVVSQYGRRLGLMLSLALLVLALFHLAVMFAPANTVVNFNQLASYLLPLNLGEVVFLVDFMPKFTLEALGERGEIWKRAQQAISDNWLFGVSNGGFRIGSDNPVNNSHSILFQPFIDGGIVAGLSLSALVLLLIKRLRKLHVSVLTWALLAAIFSGLLVDFQPDHSLAWIICMSYLVMLSIQFRCNDNDSEGAMLVKPTVVENSNRFAWIVAFVALVVFAVVIVIYAQRQSRVEQLDLSARLGSLSEARDLEPIIIIDSLLQLEAKLHPQKQAAMIHLINQVPLSQQACLYQYGRHSFIQALVDKQARLAGNGNLRYFTVNKQPLVFYQSDDIDCSQFLYPDHLQLTNSTWLSDSRYYYLYNDKKLDWPLWINTTISSSLWAAKQGDYQFSFDAKGQFGVGQWPNLQFCLRSQLDDAPLDCQNIKISTPQISGFSVELKLKQPAVVYLSVAYDNEKRDLATKEDRNVWLYPNSFEINLVHN